MINNKKKPRSTTKNASRTVEKRAIFLDRDGTINKEVDVLRRVSQLRILSGAARAIREFNKQGFLVIIITNQPVVARGWLIEKGVDRIHKVLIERLKQKGAHIDAIYYCPHHPNANLKKYRIVCRCRKPKPGMIYAAMKKFRITPRGSFMIGDHAWDILAGKAAKLKTIFVKTSARSSDSRFVHVKSDFVVKNLMEAAKVVKRHMTYNM